MLIDEDGGDIEPGSLPFATVRITHRMSIEKVLRMRMRTNFGAQECDPLPGIGSVRSSQGLYS
jgi:hypothetical protein